MTTLADHVQGRIVGALGALPSRLQRLLSGGRAVVVDGQELAAEYQLLLRLVALSGHPGLAAMTPARARAEMQRSAHVFAGPPPAAARPAAAARPDDFRAW